MAQKAPPAKPRGGAVDVLPPTTTAAIPAPPKSPAEKPGKALPGHAVASFSDCAGCPELVTVPAGKGVFGSAENEPGRDAGEGRQREIVIAKPFALGRYEVTRAQFAAFAAAAGYKSEPGCFVWSDGHWVFDQDRNWSDPGFKQTDRDPVVCVSWKDATAYTAWLARKTGKPYRLPSEFEWEYAARAGSGAARHWGADSGRLCRYGNGADLTANKVHPEWPSAACSDGFVNTAPVGSFEPNAFGLYDMLGNAAEWTADCWKEPGSETASAGDAEAAAADCSRRVVRGGAFNYTQRLLRSAARLKANAAGRIFNLGFRVARDAP
jgi:formylglycine-generating enzyme required for sulfatase activity